MLESLQFTAGVQSFILAINPNDTDDEGFLGGSSLGREFWRSLRGGGTAGAKALKSLAISTLQSSTPSSPAALHGTGIPSRQRETAHSLKSEVYARVRTLLRDVFDTSCHSTRVTTHLHDRSTSGVRNAEMKWTNHGNLSVYGVRLEGWPGGIPMQNPSTLSTGQNRELRDALAGGTLRFCRINAETGVASDAATPSCGPAGNSSDLSWAIVEEFTTPVRGFLLHIDRISVSNILRGYLNLRFHILPTQIESRIMKSQRTISQVSWTRLHQSRPTEYESESILSLVLARVGRYWGERLTYQRQT